LWLGRPVRFLVRVFSPVAAVVAWIVELILQTMGVKYHGLVEDRQEVSHEELRGAIDLHHIQGAVQTSDRNMLGGILDLKDLQVADIMIHRKSMVLIDGDLPPEEMLDRVLSQPHTRLPVYKVSIILLWNM
jgi:Mg2+/Co2+ transporter CorB